MNVSNNITKILILFVIFGLILLLVSLKFPNYLSLKDKQLTRVSLTSYIKDTSRFIAHAGGEINGYKYTNSLNALEYSYNQGFRLFELDILKTSDGKFVAAHDWSFWKRVTKFKGDIPPSKHEFMNNLLFEKYTPLDLKAINTWFGVHKDAILITDKVNKPIEFSNQFIDKTRLMMELFSWNAINEGLSKNIKSVMPTGDIILQIKGDKIKFLKKLGITELVISRKKINAHKKLLTELIEAGIRVYIFHINSDNVNSKSEIHMVCNERQYFYGIYANKWDFNTQLNCQQTE